MKSKKWWIINSILISVLLLIITVYVLIFVSFYKQKPKNNEQGTIITKNAPIELSNIIPNDTNLGIIKTNGTDIPTIEQIKTAIKNTYSSLDIDKINITDITKTSAKIIPNDKILYVDEIITVNFNITKSMALSTIISNNTNLGIIKTDENNIPTIEQIKNVIRNDYSNLDIDKINITDITKTSAKIIPNDKMLYVDEIITVNFNITKPVALNTLIPNNTNLGIIKTNGADIPTIEQIKTTIKKSYSKIEIDKITIANITKTSAKIIPNNKIIYTNEVLVDVTFKVDKSVALNTLIPNNTNLGIIKTNGADIPTIEQIKTTIKKSYSKVEIDKINIANITKTSAKIIPNNKIIYTNEVFVDVTFKVDKSVALNTLIPNNTNLGIIKTYGADIPTIEQIKNVIRIENYNLDIDKITIADITKTSAIIVPNDKIIYTNKILVDVTFEVDKSVALNILIPNNTNLGIIKTNGADIPTIEQIKTTIKKSYSKVEIDKITIADITKTSAIIVPNDKITYTNEVLVDVTFKVDKSVALNTLIPNNANLGIIKTNGADIPTIEQIKTTIKKSYSKVEIDKINIADITKTSAVIVPNDKIIYTNEVLVDVTFKVDKS